jgi:hypothetical protein
VRLWESLLPSRPQSEARSLGVNDWAEFFGPSYAPFLTQSWSPNQEQPATSAASAYRTNGPIFSLVLARMQVFAQARFAFTRFTGGKRGDLFGTPALSVLERPWRGGTTGDLLARMELDVSLAGTSFVRRLPNRLHVLKPLWCTVIIGSNEDADHPNEAGDAEIAGLIYKPPNARGTVLLPEQFAMYAPIPDPDNNFLGMAWPSTVLRDIQSDDLALIHKRRFFENAAPQPLDARVLTPSGWTTMGALAVGDEVIGSDGKAHDVTGVFPQGEQDIYRVTFTDGSSTECTGNHVWHVASAYDRKHGTHRVMSLDELVSGGLHYRSGPAKWSVPLVDPVQFTASHAELPIDPYLMGLLLGDGSFRGNGKGSGGVSLSVATSDVEETKGLLNLPDGVTISGREQKGCSELYFRGPGSPKRNPLTDAVRGLGLFDVIGHEKFIPAEYMRAGVTDRIAVLQGLIDSDGSVSPTAVRFTNTSRRLIDDLVDLVGSIGGTTSVTLVDRGHRPQWTVVIKRLPEGIVPARLARKASAFRPISRVGRYRYIDRVERVGRKQAQCIRVDSDDHLYVTDDHIVTHNTPNMAIRFDASQTLEQVREFKELMEAEHKGAFNAYKTLYLGGGADATPLGKDFREMEFSVTQGKGESRLASAAGVPPSWVGFSEGLQGSALNAGNFNAARRRFADGTMHHLWSNAAASLETLVKPPDGAQLWYDTRDMPFMREDAEVSATVQGKEAQTIRTLADSGFKPESIVLAVKNNDWALLKHTGLPSVQVQPEAQPAGVGTSEDEGESDDDA